MKNPYRILAALLACGVSLSAAAAVTASLDRDRVASGETVRLLLQHDGNTDGQPDISPLKRDFDVLGSSSGSSMQIVNGHTSAQTQVNLVLAPKHDGKIRIPPLQWGDQKSPTLELTVGGNSGNGGAGRQPAGEATAETSHVFLTATLDQQRPYVQAAVVLTVRIHADQPIYQASLDFPAGADVLVKQLGKDQQTSETRNGRTYQVIERKYLLFPQRSGPISIDGPVLDAQVQDSGGSDPFGNDSFFGNLFGRMPLAGMMNATRPLRLRAKAVAMNVQPRPAGATGSNWLPAQKVTLEETWRPGNATIHVGDPVTRHLHLAALGLTGAQLPDLAALMAVPDGIKAYPDQAKLVDSPQGDSNLGSRDQDIALIASRAGRYALPAMRLSWWDSAHNLQREAVLPEHTLEILPAAGAPAATAAPTANPAPSIPAQADAQANAPAETAQSAQATHAPPWQWISLGLGLLWLGTVLAWWRSRRRTPPPAPGKDAKDSDATTPAALPAGSAFKAFQRACHDGDPRAARQYLLAWASAVWPAHPPPGLNALSRLLDDAKLAEPLRQLDRACYTDCAWQGEALAQAMSKPPAPAAVAERQQALPELYPELPAP